MAEHVTTPATPAMTRREVNGRPVLDVGRQKTRTFNRPQVQGEIDRINRLIARSTAYRDALVAELAEMPEPAPEPAPEPEPEREDGA